MSVNLPKALQIFLEEVNLKESPHTPEAVRELSEKTVEMYALPKLDIPFIKDRFLELEDHRVPVRIYHPQPNEKRPIMLYFHGGGHLCGSLETHDAICRRIAIVTECTVISVAYRLAPEFPYPAGLLDCVAVFEKRADLLKGIPVNIENVFLAGDSAGGNLALSTCYQMKEQKDTAIKGVVLIYPSVDFSMQYESFERNGKGFLLTAEKISWYFAHYFPPGADRAQASPIHFKHLEWLPPVYIAVAEYDPLFDEGIAFANKLRCLGVSVTLEEFKGMIHVFAQLEKLVPDHVLQLIASIGSFIKKLSGKNSS